MIAATRNESIIAKAMMTRIQELQFVMLSLESVMQYHSIRQEGRKSLTYACMYIHPSESDTISAIATENAPCYIKPPAAVSLGTSAFPCGNADWHERWLSVVNTPENQPADGAHETAKRESGSDRLFETPIISIQLDF